MRASHVGSALPGSLPLPSAARGGVEGARHLTHFIDVISTVTPTWGSEHVGFVFMLLVFDVRCLRLNKQKHCVGKAMVMILTLRVTSDIFAVENSQLALYLL